MNNPIPFDIQPRIAIYPCCAGDIIYPSQILKETNLADQIIFCDLNDLNRYSYHDPQDDMFYHHDFQHAVRQKYDIPCSFLQGDFHGIFEQLPIFDVLFYRGDSDGEGGSGIRVLGDFLPKILSRMLVKRGYIITDGSNSFGNNFKDMQRPEGLKKYGRHFQLHSQQLSSEQISRLSHHNHGELKIFTVDWDESAVIK